MAVPALGVYAAELFPTSRRGGANGGISALSVVGSVVGLLLAGLLLDQASPTAGSWPCSPSAR